MTFRQLLKEGRVYIVHTTDAYWDIHGNRHDDSPSTRYNWEEVCMTYQEARALQFKLPTMVNRLYVFADDFSKTLKQLAAREDPNDTRSISERSLYEQQLPVIPYTPKNKKKSDGIPMWANIVFGIPLSIIRAALKM